MADELVIVRQAETFRIGLDGVTRRMRSILYTVGVDGPFTLEIPEDEYQPARVRQLLEEDARRIMEIRGKR